MPSWKERVIELLSRVSEREQIGRERKNAQDRLKRLGRAYIDGMIDESEYDVQKYKLRAKIDSLVIPEADASMKAGELIENIGLLWQKATLEERHQILEAMVETVYLDLWANRSVVSIQPKTAFYPLFKSLHKEGKVTIFYATESRPVGGIGRGEGASKPTATIGGRSVPPRLGRTLQRCTAVLS